VTDLNQATMYWIIEERFRKCVTERHKRGLRRHNENYKFKYNWRILNISWHLGCAISRQSYPV